MWSVVYDQAFGTCGGRSLPILCDQPNLVLEILHRPISHPAQGHVLKIVGEMKDPRLLPVCLQAKFKQPHKKDRPHYSITHLLLGGILVG